MTLAGGSATVRDGLSDLVVGTVDKPIECKASAGNEVVCREGLAPYLGFDVHASLGDEDDTFAFAGTFVPEDHHTGRIEGGEGADVLRGGPMDDELDGGPGADEAYGNDGDDRIVEGDPDAQPRDDLADGGRGRDELAYAPHVGRALTIDLRAGRAGAGDERDRLVSIEDVSSGDGGDHIVGTAGRNRIDGGLGRDRIEGRAGDDLITATGKGTADAIDAGSGDDVIIPGSVYDALRRRGTVVCGPGEDTVWDPAPVVTLRGCERAGSGASPHPYRLPIDFNVQARIRPVAIRSRSLTFSMTAGDLVKGTVNAQIRGGGRLLGSGRHVIRSERGPRRFRLTVRVSAATVRAIRRGREVTMLVEAGRIPSKASRQTGWRARLAG